MPINTNAVFKRLQDQSIRDQSFLQASFIEYGDAASSVSERDEIPNNPITDRFVYDLGSEGIGSLTNFTISEFETPWSFVDDATNSAWLEGRGRRSATSPKDCFFMAMTVLKHYSSWDKHTADFGFKPPTFEKLVMRVLAVVEPVLYERFIVCQSMSSLVQSGHRFSNYPYASYEVDVKFQPSLRPMGRLPSRSAISVESIGSMDTRSKLQSHLMVVASPCPARILGRPHDFTILHSLQAIHKAMLEKTPDELLRPDYGELSTQYPESWACLVDMAYIGIGHVLRGIHPKRRPANGMLDADDLVRNERISSDRVVVENFFGRVCALWKISYATFSWSEKNYDVIKRTAFSLTNFHLSLMPLRSEDETFYAYVMARYERMATETKRKRAESQRRYRLNRQERLTLDHNRAGRLLFS